MIAGGKIYKDEFICKEKGYQQEVQNFIETFEKENHISIRVRQRDLEKAEKYIREELNMSDEDVRFYKPDFPFDTFEINGNDFRVYVRKEDDNGLFAYALLTKNKEEVKHCMLFNSEKGGCATIFGDKNDGYMPALGLAVKWVILYILGMKKTYLKGEKRKENKRETKEIKKSDEKKLLAKTHYVTIDDAVYLCKTEYGTARRKIMCECYGVRGHYRHYKNGAVVFIKPYKKGTKRNEGNPVKQNYKI